MAPCTAIKKNGVPCSFQAKYGEFCGFHAPKTTPREGATSEEQCVECPICYDNVKPNAARVLSCNHTFHKSCVNKWLRTCSTCPMCRAPVARQRPPVAPIQRRPAVRGIPDQNVRVARNFSRGELTTLLDATRDMADVSAAVRRLLEILS